MALYTILLWILLLLIPLLVLVLKCQNKQQQHLPPSPPKLPLLGNLHQLGALPHQSLWKLSNRYGPVMLLKLGRLPLVVISSAEAAREVLKVHDLDCCSRPMLTGSGKFTYNCLDISFAPYGDHWRQMKKLCVIEIFSQKRVQSFRFIREEEVDSLMCSISKQASSSDTLVDLSQKVYALTGSIVLRMAFGKRFEGSQLNNHRFKELIDASMSIVGGFTAEECLPYVGWIIDRFTGYHAKIETIFQELDSFFEQVIKDHLEKDESTEQENDQDIVDVMLQIERDQDNSDPGRAQLKKDHIKAVLMDIFLAGVDTSAITVIWAMAHLVRDPPVMNKAQEEVRNYIGKNGSIREDDIDQLQYLKMIIKETLRLHPPAPLLLPRETMSHLQVDGYDIYPKTLMQVNAWAIGRDSRYWKKPEEFFPERFIDNSVDFRGHHFEFLSFGAGRRSCPGIHMGLVTVELALANLLCHFNWKLPNEMDGQDLNMEEAVGQSLTLSKKTPLVLVPVNNLQAAAAHQ